MALGGELKDCADSLARHAAATEPSFLALGNDLQSLFRAATELTNTLEQSNARLHRELAAQQLSGATGVVAAVLTEVNSGVQSVEALLARSRAITADLAAMRPQLEVVNRVGVLLRSVAVGFAVESARRHVLALDLRNHGMSPHAEDHDFATMEADVLRWMDAQGIARAALMGHSMGGKVAMALACHRPERVERLVSVDIAPRDYDASKFNRSWRRCWRSSRRNSPRAPRRNSSSRPW